MSDSRTNPAPATLKDAPPEQSKDLIVLDETEQVAGEIAWGAVLLLAREARARMAARWLVSELAQEPEPAGSTPNISPDQGWRLAVSQVCRRRGQTRLLCEALAERKLEAFFRLRDIGHRIATASNGRSLEAAEVVRLNECIADLELELDTAAYYLRAETVAQISRLLEFVPRLPTAPTPAERARFLETEEADGFESAFEEFILAT